MFRRRRPPKGDSISFGFDSFLDLVTNVVGIIIRLILVTWVGARSYHASMQWMEVEPEQKSMPAPKLVDDPLHARLQQAKNDLDDAKTRLLAQLKYLEATKQKDGLAEQQLYLLASRRAELEAERDKLAKKAAGNGTVLQTSVSLAQIRQRSRKLLDDLKKLEALPPLKKQLKYHAPLSKAVHSDELFFECKAGRVAFIDLPAFLQEIKLSLEEIAGELKATFRVERRTAPAGPFRLRYVIERERTIQDVGATPAATSYRYGLSEWVVEPIAGQRGENLKQALAANSEFRQLTDNLDSRITVVTFWVYPDSFDLFRQLRDHLYERGHNIAGRPLTPDAPIAASRNGTASRGQ
ncbi:MAG: hypothetical protein HYX68_25665 [Planctomycetes bacterium]|nr:hypothetical protein [Planctomycetota bacterium]